MQTDIVERAHRQRQQEWERLIGLLHEADALQQRLLGDVDEFACYEFHNALNAIADDFEEWASAEEQEFEEENG
jgi:hypothetical protein